MSEWSIERELQQIAAADTTNGALKVIGVLSSNEKLDQIVPIADWHRSGAESYIFRFDVVTTEGRRVPLVLKAFTPTPSGQPLVQQFDELLRRRSLVSDAGVRTPRLYAAHKASVVEQYLPWSLSEMLQEGNRAPNSVEILVRETFILAMRLDQLGFQPISLAGDLLSDGTGVFLVDFGQDLGPARSVVGKSYSCDLVRNWLLTTLPTGFGAAVEAAEQTARHLVTTDG